MRYLILICAALFMGCSAYFQEVRENRNCHYKLDKAYRKINEQKKLIEQYSKADSLKNIEELKNSRYIDEIIHR